MTRGGEGTHGDDLPIEVWEVPHQRKKLSMEVQSFIGGVSATVRVAKPIDEKMRTKHRSDVPFYEDFNTTIGNWRVIAASPTDRLIRSASDASNWEIYCRVGAQWVLVVLGRHQRTDAYNLVSLYRVWPKAVERRREEGLIRLERGK